MSARKSSRKGRTVTRQPADASEQSIAKTASRDIDTIGSVELTQVIEAFHGPLPRPADLDAYEQAVTSAGDRIIEMAENQNTHRIAQEDLALRANIRIGTRSQWFSLVVVIVGMGLATYLATIDRLAMGGVFAFFSLAELALHIYTQWRRLNDPEAATQKPPADVPPVVDDS